MCHGIQIQNVTGANNVSHVKTNAVTAVFFLCFQRERKITYVNTAISILQSIFFDCVPWYVPEIDRMLKPKWNLYVLLFFPWTLPICFGQSKFNKIHSNCQCVCVCVYRWLSAKTNMFHCKIENNTDDKWLRCKQ